MTNVAFSTLAETTSVHAASLADADYVQESMLDEHSFTALAETFEAGTLIVATWEDDLVAQFVIASVPTSRTTMYTVPTGRSAVVRWMDLVNTTGSSKTVDVWMNGVQWEATRSVPANDKYQRDTLLYLQAGQLIEMQASAAGVNGFIGGVSEIAES